MFWDNLGNMENKKQQHLKKIHTKNIHFEEIFRLICFSKLEFPIYIPRNR